MMLAFGINPAAGVMLLIMWSFFSISPLMNAVKNRASQGTGKIGWALVNLLLPWLVAGIYLLAKWTDILR